MIETSDDNKESTLEPSLPSSVSTPIDGKRSSQLEKTGDQERTVQSQPVAREPPPSDVATPTRKESAKVLGLVDSENDRDRDGSLLHPGTSNTSDDLAAKNEVQQLVNEEDEAELVNALAIALLDQYQSDAIVQLQSYKIEQSNKQQQTQEQHEQQQQNAPLSDGEEKKVQKEILHAVVKLDSAKSDQPIPPEKKRKILNKNSAWLEEEEKEEEDEGQSIFNVDTGSRGDRSRNRIFALGHHHHFTSSLLSSPKDEEDEEDSATDTNTGILKSTTMDPPEVLLPEDDRRQQQAEIKTFRSQSSSVLAEQEPESSTVVPDSIKDRGLIPQVVGARHCTPQFCVNVTVSDDGQFATFHIERPMAATGWVSLGIGYAMTMADLIIMWPTATSLDEKVILERGAVLSRRTSHAYVEPLVVGHESSNPLGDRLSEASLYPPNEYILHNANNGPNALASTKGGSTPFSDPKVFVVQFTRPIRTKNLAHKLTPGTEQDFCWAYSPKPVSADSVLDPAAHISQHMSVGSFAMDVAANQPNLKGVLLKQKEQDLKDEAMEKEKKQKALEIENAKLAAEEEERLRNGEGGDINGDSKVGTLKHSDSIKGESTARPSSASETKWWWAGGRGGTAASSSFARQGFTCLITVALVYFFR